MTYPAYSRHEIVADGVIHAIGVTFGVTALIVLLSYSLPFQPYYTSATLAIYGFAMVLMLVCSAAYHMVPVMAWKSLLRQFDQAAIFLKIAGTYTPFAFLKLGGFWGYGLLGTVWIVAFAGAGMILAVGKKHSNAIVALYLALGWIGIILIWPLMMSMSALAFALLGVGGVLYTVGVFFHIWETLPFSNVIWHIFVLAGTVCHYFAVFTAVLIDKV